MLCSFRLVLEGKAGKEITHTVKKCVSFFILKNLQILEK